MDENSGMLTWNSFDLSPGSSAELNITGTINDDQTGETISNEACIIADENTTQGICDDENLTVARVELDILKLADNGSPAIGDQVTYTIIVNNIGNAPTDANDVHVTDTLPDGVTYVAAGGTDWTCDDINAPDIDCTYGGILNPGSSAMLDINVTVDDTAIPGDTITNKACTQSDRSVNAIGDRAPACDDEDITVNDNIDIGVLKSVDNTTPAEGTSVVYTITVTNHGPIEATNVQITDDIAYISALTVTNITASQGSMSDEETWSVGDLAAGASATLQITATVNDGAAGGTFVNNAILTGQDQTDITPENDHATATINPIEGAVAPEEEENCPCNDVQSDGSDAMGLTGMIAMMLMTLFAALFFLRKEEQFNTIEK